MGVGTGYGTACGPKPGLLGGPAGVEPCWRACAYIATQDGESGFSANHSLVRIFSTSVMTNFDLLMYEVSTLHWSGDAGEAVHVTLLRGKSLVLTANDPSQS